MRKKSELNPTDIFTVIQADGKVGLVDGGTIIKSHGHVIFDFVLVIPAVKTIIGSSMVAIASGLKGLAVSDVIHSLDPRDQDMPDPFGIAWKRVSEAETLRVGLTIPRSLTVGAQKVPMRLIITH